MKTILETKRLILREMTDDDFESLKKVITDPLNMKYCYTEPNDEYVLKWLNWCKDSYAKNGFGLWAVVLKETGEMIGDTGVSMQFIDEAWRPEIGYHLRIDQHNKGYGKEAALAVRDYFFNHFSFDEVSSYMEKDNIAPCNIAEANGMKFLHFYQGKHDINCKVYKITREEWMKIK